MDIPEKQKRAPFFVRRVSGNPKCVFDPLLALVGLVTWRVSWGGGGWWWVSMSDVVH
jgi:hypothetical protein